MRVGVPTQQRWEAGNVHVVVATGIMFGCRGVVRMRRKFRSVAYMRREESVHNSIGENFLLEGARKRIEA